MHKTLFVRWLEFTLGQEEDPQYWSTFDIRMDSFFVLRVQGNAFPKCKEVGLVSFKWPFWLCNLWMHSGEDMIFGLLKHCEISFQCLWLYVHNKTFNTWLISRHFVFYISFPSPISMQFHVIPSHSIVFYSFSFHFIPLLFTTNCWIYALYKALLGALRL